MAHKASTACKRVRNTGFRSTYFPLASVSTVLTTPVNRASLPCSQSPVPFVPTAPARSRLLLSFTLPFLRIPPLSSFTARILQRSVDTRVHRVSPTFTTRSGRHARLGPFETDAQRLGGQNRVKNMCAREGLDEKPVEEGTFVFANVLLGRNCPVAQSIAMTRKLGQAGRRNSCGARASVRA